MSASRRQAGILIMSDAHSDIVIAHQLPAALEKLLRTGVPASIAWRKLDLERAWEVPEDATVLVAVPPRGSNIVVPAEKPPGWPHNLRWIHSVAAGVDEFPAWIHDVEVVTCGRGSNSAPIAEYVLASLLAVEKHLDNIWIKDAAGWQRRELGTLDGKTLGLLGYGSIGQAVAARAAPFGMRILATRRAPADAPGPDASGASFVSLDTLLGESDHLVIALPLTNATSGLIGKAALARVKPGVHVVNISRGRILDDAALLAALERRQVGFATLDVTEPEPLPAGHPLYAHPRVHLSPHVSWTSGDRGRSVAGLFVENLRRFLAGEPLSGIVRADVGY
jgi:phosphoglycerate dehydrogenase-like enzyme